MAHEYQPVIRVRPMKNTEVTKRQTIKITIIKYLGRYDTCHLINDNSQVTTKHQSNI